MQWCTYSAEYRDINNQTLISYNAAYEVFPEKEPDSVKSRDHMKERRELPVWSTLCTVLCLEVSQLFIIIIIQKR